jgi:hypothetical protein
MANELDFTKLAEPDPPLYNKPRPDELCYWAWAIAMERWKNIKTDTLRDKRGKAGLSDTMREVAGVIKMESAKSVSLSRVPVVLVSSTDQTFKSEPFMMYVSSDLIAFVLVLVATPECNRMKLLEAVGLQLKWKNVEGDEPKDMKQILKDQLGEIGQGFSDFLGKPSYSTTRRGALYIDGKNVRFFATESVPPAEYKPVDDTHSLRLVTPLFTDAQTKGDAANVTVVPCPLGRGHIVDDTAHQTAGGPTGSNNTNQGNGNRRTGEKRYNEGERTAPCNEMDDDTPCSEMDDDTPCSEMDDDTFFELLGQLVSPETDGRDDGHPNKRACTEPEGKETDNIDGSDQQFMCLFHTNGVV